MCDQNDDGSPVFADLAAKKRDSGIVYVQQGSGTSSCSGDSVESSATASFGVDSNFEVDWTFESIRAEVVRSDIN